MITFELIRDIVCAGENMDSHELEENNSSQSREYITIRQYIYYFAKKYLRMSLAKIGKYFNKDHATVLHGLRTLNNLIDTDYKVREKISLYESKIAAFSFEENKFVIKSFYDVQNLLITCINDRRSIDCNDVVFYNLLLAHFGNKIPEKNLEE